VLRTHRDYFRQLIAVLVGSSIALVSSPALAKKFDVEMDTKGISATVIEQPAPDFPDGKMRRGQEGWVRINFVFGHDGGRRILSSSCPPGNSRPHHTVREERVEILGRILELEIDSRQYGEALATLAQLRPEPGNARTPAGLSDKIRQLEDLVQGDEAMVAAGTIYNPCDCDNGTPLWAYTPARPHFSFAEVSGNVERFEARCENHRMSAQVATGTRWSLPAEWGSCRVFVFGEGAATFEFVEHREDPGDRNVGHSAVASSDVLD